MYVNCQPQLMSDTSSSRPKNSWKKAGSLLCTGLDCHCLCTWHFANVSLIDILENSGLSYMKWRCKGHQANLKYGWQNCQCQRPPVMALFCLSSFCIDLRRAFGRTLPSLPLRTLWKYKNEKKMLVCPRIWRNKSKKSIKSVHWLFFSSKGSLEFL